jgi:hypothetical protein
LIEIIIPASVEVFNANCFSLRRSLSSVWIESGLRYSRIEGNPFYVTGLIEIVIPASVEVLMIHFAFPALIRLNPFTDHFPRTLSLSTNCLTIANFYNVTSFMSESILYSSSITQMTIILWLGAAESTVGIKPIGLTGIIQSGESDSWENTAMPK